ncbi:MAG: hypothetical protein M3R62_07630, partial [Acidobacteriota bacterium]|nr:hypothetical protein [Acidobacteriota bacterium]
TNQSISPGLDRIVRHCLEKNPEQRFHSAHDLAFDLESLSGVSSPRAGALAPARRGPAWLAKVLVAAGVLAGGLLLGHFLWKRAPGATPLFRRVTYRRGNIGSARFAPDGQSVVYAAAWEENPIELFSARLGAPESLPLGFRNADLFGVSQSSELALSIRDMFLRGAGGTGTLARAPLGGGAPREVLEFVNRADWGINGNLAIVRVVEGRERIEYPIGKVLYTSASNSLFCIRVSPAGDRVAFLESRGRGRGALGVVDLAGRSRILIPSFRGARLAWTPSGKEIWYDDRGNPGEGRVNAIDLSGRTRTILAAPIAVILHDISRNGRLLIERFSGSREILCAPPGSSTERNLGWFDDSRVADLSPDGRLLLFHEQGDATAGMPSIYIRKTDGSAAVRLGDGIACTLSEDGKLVLALRSEGGGSLTLIPTGTGTPVSIDRAGFQQIVNAELFPNGRRLLVDALFSGHGRRVYVQDLAGGKPRPISPEGFGWSGHPVSPDGKFVVAYRDWSEDLFLFSTDGGSSRAIPNTKKLDPVRWTPDGQFLFVAESGGIPARVHRLDVATGARTLWRELEPPKALNAIEIGTPALTPDGGAYAYSFTRAATSDLFVVEGLR